MSKIRVLIVDDQEIVRQGLRIILNQQEDTEAIAQAADGEEAVQLTRELKPDVVLMDIKMPHMDGIEATRVITSEHLGAQIIILTTYDADDLVFQGIRAGAQAYLLKDAGSQAILDAVRAVHRGESQLDTLVARKVMDEFRRLNAPLQPLDLPLPADMGNDDVSFVQLTERENDVLSCIARGMSNRDIAAHLHLSDGTVRNYVSGIMSKLHANDRTQLLIRAVRRKLIDL